MSHIVSGFTAFQRIARPSPPTAPDMRMICAGVIVPVTVGRPRVRAITASTLCSTRQLKAAAAPATSAIPRVAAASSPAGGSVGEASSMPITAVKTMSETTRGFVRRQNCTGTATCSGRETPSSMEHVLRTLIGTLFVSDPTSRAILAALTYLGRPQ